MGLTHANGSVAPLITSCCFCRVKVWCRVDFAELGKPIFYFISDLALARPLHDQNIVAFTVDKMSVIATLGRPSAWGLLAAQLEAKENASNIAEAGANTATSSPAGVASATMADTATAARAKPRVPSLSSGMLAQLDMRVMVDNDPRIANASMASSSPAAEASATTADTATTASVISRSLSLSSEMLAQLDMRVMAVNDPVSERYANLLAIPATSAKSPQTSIIA